MKITLRLLATLLATGAYFTSVFADAPSDYYSSCENKCGKSLLTALYEKIGPHTTISYDGLWTVYKTSDVRDNGKVWDMYSTKEWTVGQEHCGNYKLVGDCINREHSFPKSWFNDAKPMYSDAFHLYPTDGKVNGQRSNFPYGECANGTTLPSNGSIRALGRLGKSTFAGYSGTVFEPDDEYKGDFARSYFYMATAYNNKIGGWKSDMLARNSYPCFSTWALNLLLKWHRQDPVSSKETKRNDAVYAAQKNRNPFIDHPELVEHIWGDKKNVNWTGSEIIDPALTLPVSGSTVKFGVASVNKTRTATVTVKGVSLTNAVSVSVSGTGFSTSTSSLSASSVCSDDGTPLTISFTATAAGSYTGTLRLTSGTVTSTVNLTASAVEGLPATPATDISDRSFIAHWSYIGDDDANKCYTLTVTDVDGNVIDTYPRSVPAEEEEYLVDELEPLTAYKYSIQSASGIKSNVMDVTTAAPIPSIQFMYAGDLYFTAEPGEPSDAAEILLDIDNIDTDITISVSEPFQLSSDKADWSTSITVNPVEDRFYMRLFSNTVGTYQTSIKAVAGDYMNDDAEVSGAVAVSPSFFEDFEHEAKGSYDDGSLQGSACRWDVTDAGIWSSTTEAFDGKNSVRLGKTSSSVLAMAEDKTYGIGVITLNARGFNDDGAFEFDLDVSTDQGVTWETVTHHTVDDTSAGSYKEYTFTVNRPGNARFRICQTAGKRINIDNIAITNYTAGIIDGVDSDFNSWDAYCRDGQLAVELADESEVMICSLDGIVVFNGTMKAGTTTLDIAKGLYIVNVADFARRVLVK